MTSPAATETEHATPCDQHEIRQRVQIELVFRDGRWDIHGSDPRTVLYVPDEYSTYDDCACGDEEADMRAATKADAVPLPGLEGLRRAIGRHYAEQEEAAAWEENTRRDVENAMRTAPGLRITEAEARDIVDARPVRPNLTHYVSPAEDFQVWAWIKLDEPGSRRIVRVVRTGGNDDGRWYLTEELVRVA